MHKYIVAAVVITCFFLGSLGHAAPLSADQQANLRLEFENIALKIQLAQQRQREIATILAPYVSKATTAGPKAPKKGAKK